jgi:hypothetical protein
MAELPQMRSSAHTHSTYNADRMLVGNAAFTPTVTGVLWRPDDDFAQTAAVQAVFPDPRPPSVAQGLTTRRLQQPVPPQAEETPAMPARRLVQVFIADTNENVPLDRCLLYSGKQQLTDLTDQELFFEIDIKKLLDDHNEKRTKLYDKKVKERTEHLEPARVRDLKMTVVTIASF